MWKYPWRSVNIPLWVIFTFFKLYKWHQIAQRINVVFFLRGETCNFVSSHIDAVFTFLLAQTFDHYMNISGTLKLPFIHYPESPEENKKVEKPSNLFPRWKPFGAGIIIILKLIHSFCRFVRTFFTSMSHFYSPCLVKKDESEIREAEIKVKSEISVIAKSLNLANLFSVRMTFRMTCGKHWSFSNAW